MAVTLVRSSAASGKSHSASSGLPTLPFARHRVRVSDTLSVTVYDSGEHTARGVALEPPLLVVHSVNAAASAFEMQPVVVRQAVTRRVVALDLPGFGASDKHAIRYTPQLMREAIVAVLDWMGLEPADIMALSLACEFAAEATLARPRQVRTLTLISPTGMEGRRHGGGRSHSPLLRRLLHGTVVGKLLYRVLTHRVPMNAFLARVWGTPAYDRRLLAQGLICAGQPGARHAPLDFVAGALFTPQIIERYRLLPVPVWVCHGTRGQCTDYDACPAQTGAANDNGKSRSQRKSKGKAYAVVRTPFESGAMPHFEKADAFDTAYRAFLAGATGRRQADSGLLRARVRATAGLSLPQGDDLLPRAAA
jgi:pimeloyl-ACP methyl ester carboxylesterase